MARRKRELTDKIAKIEFKLKEFYYPIFLFKEEQIIWDKILKLYKNPKPTSPPIKILPASKLALQSVHLTIHNPETSSSTDGVDVNEHPIQKEKILYI